MDDIINTYPKENIYLSSLLDAIDISIIGVIIIGIIIAIIIIALIIAIFDIKSNTARTVKELKEINQRLSFICQSLDYQNKVTAQSRQQNQGDRSGTPAESNNRY